MFEILIKIVEESWKVLLDMSPYLIFGFFIAGILSVYISEKFIQKHLGGGDTLSVVKSSFFGVPLPLCSCGVIPVGISLKENGASNGSAISFLISTPQTGVDSIMVTYSLLGPVYAIYRPIVAFISGVFGGVLVNIFGDEKITDNTKENPEVKSNCYSSEKIEKKISCCSAKKIEKETSCCSSKKNDQTTSCCSSEKNDKTTSCCAGKTEDTLKNKNKFIKAMKYGFYTLPKDIGKSLALGIILAGIIAYVIPPNFFAEYLQNEFAAMFVMLIFGIPLYVCSTSSVPVAASLITAGISPGAALVFLMTGPATNAATITTIWKSMGRKIAMIYLSAIIITSFLSGYILNLLYEKIDIAPQCCGDELFSYGIKTGFAIMLILVILPSFKNSEHH